MSEKAKDLYIKHHLSCCMNSDQLELLGLNKYEALAFESLSRLGKAGASDISRESHVPYGRIYDILESLISKGLIRLIPEKAKRYTIADTETLKGLIRTKKAQLDELEGEADKIHPAYTEEEKIFIAKGQRNFYKLTEKLDSPKKTDYRIKYTVEWKPHWAERDSLNVKKGIDVKNLVRVNKDTEINIKKYLKNSKSELRSFDNEGVAMNIIDDEYVWIALIKSNTLVVIKDKPFVRLIRKMFLNTWKISESVQ